MINNTKKILRVLNFLAFIPYFGYLIIVFWGAFMIDKFGKGKIYTLSFMILSLIILALFSLPIIVVMCFFIIGKVEPVSLQIIILMLLSYVIFLCAALTTVAVLKRKLEKLL